MFIPHVHWTDGAVSFWHFFLQGWNVLKQVCVIYVGADFLLILMCMSSPGFSYLHVGVDMFDKAVCCFSCLVAWKSSLRKTIPQTLGTKELQLLSSLL